MRGLLVGIAVATKPGEAAYIPIGHQLELEASAQLPLATVLDALRPLLEDADASRRSRTTATSTSSCWRTTA